MSDLHKKVCQEISVKEIADLLVPHLDLIAESTPTITVISDLLELNYHPSVLKKLRLALESHGFDKLRHGSEMLWMTADTKAVTLYNRNELHIDRKTASFRNRVYEIMRDRSHPLRSKISPWAHRNVQRKDKATGTLLLAAAPIPKSWHDEFAAPLGLKYIYKPATRGRPRLTPLVNEHKIGKFDA